MDEWFVQCLAVGCRGLTDFIVRAPVWTCNVRNQGFPGLRVVLLLRRFFGSWSCSGSMWKRPRSACLCARSFG